MKNNNNLQKLSWLQSEIDNTINEAVNFLATKKAGFDLSSVAEKQMDLSVFANYIHQIVGSLQMVEIDSIALFSQEIEWSADRLAQKQAFVLDDFGRLQEQAQQISDSIHRMLDGLPELSIEQFESMNLLRRERGEKPCGIELFFDPNLDVDFEMDEQQAVNHDDYRVLVGAHQEDYRESLLLWLKSGDPVAIQSIRSTFSKLHSLARFGAAVRLWWIAYAFVDTVRLNKHVNKRRQTAIFAKLNEIMAFIASKGESVLIRDGAVSVIRHMLFAIVTSEERSETMKDVVKRFNLQQYTQAASVKTAVDEMAVISANLRRLRDYIDGKIDLSKVQKVMTDFFNRDQSNSVHLDWVSSQMHSLAEACANHNQPQLERLANELSEISIKLESDNEMFKNEFTSLNAATAVMLLEHSLTDDVVPDESWEKKVHTKIAQLRMMQGKPVNEEDLLEGEGTAADNSQLHALIAGEIDEHLRYTEVALTQFSEDMTRLNILDGIPERMKQVRGALQMLGHQKIALLARMGEEKFTEVIRGKRSPTLQVLEALAVTVSALMQGTQDLKEGFVRHDDLIERSLKDIGLAFGGGVSRKDVERLIATSSEYLNDWVLDNTNYNALEQLRLNLRDIAALSKKTGLLQVVSLVEEQNRLLDIVSEDPEFISTEVKATLTHSTAKVAEYLIDLYGTEETDEEREFDQKIAAKAAAITSSDEDPDAIRYHDDMSVDELPLVPKHVQEEEMPLEATQQAKEKAVEVDDEDSIDPEMLDIYIEESEELLTAAQQFYKQCLNDPSDRESLGELRRQFHTLKGSGRMVGLDKVGELSWLVESLLNYVLDTGETLNRDMLHFVDDATSTLQALLAGSYADQEKLDVVSWGDRADQLTAIVEQEENPVASKEVTLKHSLLKDPELRQVFVQETHVNLLKIKPIAEALLLKPSLCPVELYIAVHTLKGNMRGLLLDEIAVAYDKVEQVLTLVREKNQPVGNEVAVALRDLQIETEQFLQQAEQQNYAMSVESKVWPDVAQRMQDLLESLEVQVEETQVEETQVEETQVEETQVEETQVEETQVEETQVEETQVEEALGFEAAIDETSID
ncbi:MAG: Hpt domain-containing protein, partial [Arenicella sp.]